MEVVGLAVALDGKVAVVEGWQVEAVVVGRDVSVSHGADSSAGLDGDGHHRAAAMGDGVAAVDRMLLLAEVEGAVIADRVEEVLEDGEGMMRTQQSIPGSPFELSFDSI